MDEILDPRYIPAFYIEDVLLDKDTGAPLSGGIVTFERDSQRGTLKPVYQITGTSPNYTFTQLPDPMILSSIGTFEDALGNPTIPYFFPYDDEGNVDLYYILVTNSNLVEQFDREAVPYINDNGGGGGVVTSTLENELSNPQFSEVLFNSPTTLSFTAVSNLAVKIAPSWEIVVTCPGTGTVTLSVTTPVGSLNDITNPGTLLNINSAGVTTLLLRQRLFGSPNLWGSGYLAGTFVAKTFAGVASTLNLFYSQSNGIVVNQLITSGTLTSDGLYHAFPGSMLIPPSNSSGSFPTSYVDIFFNIPASTQIEITSVMVAFTNQISIDDNIVYTQTSFDRQDDQLFHYYNPKLQYKPIPSYTIGWDFPFNPAQDLGREISNLALGSNGSRYIADQTIAFEAVSNVLSYSISSPNGLSVFTLGTTQFAIIQYLDLRTARELLAQRMSVCLNGLVSMGTLAGTVSIYYSTDAQLPNVAPGSYDSIVASMSAGKPLAFNGTWLEVLRGGLGNATFTLTTTPSNFLLTGFDATATTGYSTATYLAIVVGFNAMPSTQTMAMKYCTLNAGDIATPPPSLSLDQTLAALEHYYEKSYPLADNPGTASTVLNQNVYNMTYTNNGITATLFTIPFGNNFRNLKRKAPLMYLFSPDSGAVNNVRGHIYTNGVARNEFDIASTNWTISSGDKGYYCLPANATGLGATGAASSNNTNTTITWQYVADSRFGIVL